MKIFKKIKEVNGRRKIYFCGIKILSYKKKIIPVKKDFLDYIVNSVILSDGITDFQMNYLKTYFSSKNAKKEENNHILWLITITSLYQNNEILKAQILLLDYIEKFGTKDIINYAPICKLMKEMQKGTDKINEIANIYDNLIGIRKEQRFENMVKNAKNIAIVGRSTFLIGKSLGQEIDSHDLVIRFNNSDISGKYAEDYGVKEDVNVINLHLCNEHNSCKLCLYKDFRTYGMFPEVTEKLKKELSSKEDVLGFGIKNYVCQSSGVDDPTSGAIIVAWVEKILGNLDKVDVYGFSFQDPNHSLEHFDNEKSINTNNHDMNTEIHFMKSLLENSKKII